MLLSREKGGIRTSKWEPSGLSNRKVPLQNNGRDHAEARDKTKLGITSKKVRHKLFHILHRDSGAAFARPVQQQGHQFSSKDICLPR